MAIQSCIQDGIFFLMTLLIFILSSLATPIPGVTYSELQGLGPDCYPRDTCAVTLDVDDVLGKSCECDRSCAVFDTCCVDSPYRTVEQKTKADFSSCVQLYRDESQHVLMTDKCKPDWTGEDYIREMCLGDGELLDAPLLLVPVTGSNTNITYKNVFCAACNDVVETDVTMWNLYVSRLDGGPISKPDIERLRFDSSLDSWTIRDGISDAVRFALYIPSQISRHVSMCDDVISACARNWTDDAIRGKCASYMAVVFAGDMRFRNVHCAICNFVNPGSLQCTSLSSEFGRLEESCHQKKPLSFAILLDVNMSDGDIVGCTELCKKPKRFDSYKKKCLVPMCPLPDMVWNGDKCVRTRYV